MAVKEKWLQGGGLGPVVGGEDHLPVEGEVTHILPAYLIKVFFLHTLCDGEHMEIIAPPPLISVVSILGKC